MFSSLIHFERTSIKVNVARLSMRFSCYSSWWFHCFLVHSGQCPTSVRVAKVSQSVTQSGYFTHLSPTSGHSHYFRIKCSLPEKRLQKILVSGNYNFWRRISKSAHEFASTKQVIIQDWLGLFIEVHPILMLRQFRMFRTKLAKSFDLSVQARSLFFALHSPSTNKFSAKKKCLLSVDMMKNVLNEVKKSRAKIESATRSFFRRQPGLPRKKSRIDWFRRWDREFRACFSRPDLLFLSFISLSVPCLCLRRKKSAFRVMIE